MITMGGNGSKPKAKNNSTTNNVKNMLVKQSKLKLYEAGLMNKQEQLNEAFVLFKAESQVKVQKMKNKSEKLSSDISSATTQGKQLDLALNQMKQKKKNKNNNQNIKSK